MKAKSRYMRMTPEEKRLYNERCRAWQKRNPEKVREAWNKWQSANKEKERERKARYEQRRKKEPKIQRVWDYETYKTNAHKKIGLTRDQHRKMVEEQEGRCAICRRTPRTQKLFHVDHCHTTGKIRGLLCINCNNGLGQLGDSVERLGEAILYLLKQ